MKNKALLSVTILSLLLSMMACNTTSSEESSVEQSSSSLVSKESKESSSVVSSIEPSSSSQEISSSAGVCNHTLGNAVTEPATIIKCGCTVRTCTKCGYREESNYTYRLNEFTYPSKTYLYDGKEKELLIDGMIPYGCTVKYTNNKLTEIGSKDATAQVYSPDNELLATVNGTITIVENNGLPNVKLNTTSGIDPDYHDKTNYTEMTTSVDNCDSKYVMNAVAGGIRARGNSTNYDIVSKHPWRLKFNSKVNMLGLNKGQKFKSWVLLAEYFDQSLLRNSTAFNLGGSLFNHSGNYTSDYQHVNFYMNGDYKGVYLLAEQQQANKNRIDVAEPEDDSSEKVGYIIEVDIRGADDDPHFTCGPKSQRSATGTWSGGQMINGVRVVSSTYSIKSDTYSSAQRKMIEKYVSNAMTALINVVTGEKNQIVDSNGELQDSPYNTQYETLNAFLDVESLMKTCLLNEIMKNYDVGYGSFYLYLDLSANAKYKRLTFGAPWDFDLSSGNKQSGNVIKTDNEFIKAGFGEANFNPWLYLISQTDFYDSQMARYYSVFNNSSIFEKSINFIDYATSAYATDFANNVTRYKNGTGKDRMTTRQYSNQIDASNYFKDWLQKRKKYMDSVYLK